MIPVISYLLLRGRCRKCKVQIGSEKFYLELIGGILAVIVYKVYLLEYFITPLNMHNVLIGVLFSLFFILLYIVFSVITFYDFRHKLVPANFSLILLVIGLAFEVYRAYNYNNFYGGVNSFFYLDLFSGIIIALPFYLIYVFSKGRAVGFGDILIYIGVGYLAGFIFGVSIFFISIWLGAIVSIFLTTVFPKKYNRHSKIPFAPFILIAVILVMLMRIDILGLVAFI